MSENLRPWFRFFHLRFFNSATVRKLGDAGAMAYLRLLSECWDRDGSLPEDEEELRLIAGAGKRQWARWWALISRKFSKNGTGGLRNAFIDSELAILRERSDQARAAALARHGRNATALRTHASKSKSKSKSKKKSTPPSPPSGGRGGAPTGRLLELKLAHPEGRRASDGFLFQLVRQLKADGYTLDFAIERTRLWASTEEWTKQGGKYATHQRKFFTEGKWLADPPELRASGRGAVNRPWDEDPTGGWGKGNTRGRTTPRKPDPEEVPGGEPL